ncbi:scavenger receptor class B member 1-like [Apis cerana]|uniref:scavenger receptor class B member 1-like n=1 Tax=Apis cerana TaxID=7461 RepID=UPI0007E2C7AE|nr:scavenger receptor class B member 1-like [Apis cerana]XP_028523057.1 scavenger receptor class B member 1-like [Apis cerana]XP_061938836.1 scavenger receptor class B member 1-like [Apis cerana]
MKFANPLQRFKKCIILFSLGISCSILSYLIYIINPSKLILEYNLEMRPDSMVFELWKKPPIQIYIKVYIFNITNMEEFLKGGVKLKVEEIGPYVYQEIVENHNITWHENMISYIPKRTIIYVPEMSINDPKKDIIHVPNIPMLGLSSSLHDAGFLVNYPWTSLVNILDSKPILKLNVHDYLWGYEDKLIRFASGIMPNFIDFIKFGLLDRMYDEGENIISINIAKNKNMTEEEGRYLSIQLYNGSPGMSQWGYREEDGNETYPENTICNRIKGTTEGELFPSYLDKHAVFRIFRKAFCKAIPIVFKKEVIMDNGLNGYLYSMSDDFLDTSEQNPDNACYCRKKKQCLKKGLSDITPCYYRIPAAMSLPHFLHADSSIYDNVEGLNPDSKRHTSQIIIQPTVGIPMKINSKIQINLVMQRTIYNSKIRPFNDMTIPLFWSDLVMDSLPNDLTFILKLILQICPMVQTVIIWLLGIAGMTMFVLSLLAILWTINQQQKPLPSERRESCDLRIPLNYNQYTTIRILPNIKKKSKSDLFS